MNIRPLDKNDYKPLYVQLSERLIEYIKENKLQPGDPMPSQNELEKYVDVSQMTIRIALQRLASEGHIYSIQGRGTFVAEKKLSLVPDNIIPFEEQMSNQGIQAENELIEELIIHPIEIRRLQLNLPDGSKTYKVRRLKRITGEPVCMESNHMPPDFKGHFNKNELTHVPFLKLFNSKPETRISEIDYSIKSVLLLQVEADLLGVPVDTPALVQHRVMYNSSKPILTGKLVYLANKVEIRFKTSQTASPILMATTITQS